jgi:hypothetical protein
MSTRRCVAYSGMTGRRCQHRVPTHPSALCRQHRRGLLGFQLSFEARRDIDRWAWGSWTYIWELQQRMKEAA